VKYVVRDRRLYAPNGDDVTDLFVAQRRAEIARRLDMLGAFAGNVAHQINNPLAIINVHAELIKDDLTTLHAKHRDEAKRFTDINGSMEELEAAVAAITKITSDMRTFSQLMSPNPASVRRCVEWAVKTASTELRDRAFPVTKIGFEGCVSIDEPRFGRILLELVRNAAASIEMGAPENNEVSIVATVAQNTVVIEVRDTGSGIAEDQLERIFAPRISVDAEGVPSVGVGLLECREAIVAAGGTIAIDSAEGQGTVVRIELAKS
jgi:two-component system NtrC family sensor kinase